MADLRRKHNVMIVDHSVRHSEERGYAVDAIAESTEIKKLQAAGYEVETHEDVDVRGKERQAEVGRGNRFAPRGGD
jgi:hypothetical protein